MANVRNFLKKEIENNRVLMDNEGFTFTTEKVKEMCKKRYIDGAKKGLINIEEPFTNFYEAVLENEYTDVEALLINLFPESEVETPNTDVEEATEEAE